MNLDRYYNEKVLVNALIEGDEGAYRYVIRMYREPVIRLCRGFTGSFEDAEDLAQDIFLEVIRSVGKFRSQSTVSTWIYRIAVNKSLNYIRDNKKRNYDKFGRGDEESFRGGDEYDADIPLVNKEHAEALHNALNKLPEAQRTAFILSKYEDLRYSEIADIMRTSISSVESLLFRAKRNLQDKLREYYEKNLS